MTPGSELTWAELGELDGVRELALPWAVGGCERLGLHASLRRFYRLSPDPSAAAGDVDPESVVLVLYESDDDEAVARYERSARWMLAAGVRVPRVYAAGDRALIVEDGGDRLLSEHPDTPGLVDRYVEAARVILALQSHGIEDEGPNPDWSLDEERLRNELEFTEKHALRGWLEDGPSAEREAAFDRLAQATAAIPTRMCHRDYHSRNLLVGDELMVLDFQDTMRGPLFYDLASLLRDDYRSVPTEAAAAAIETYWRDAHGDIRLDPGAGVPEEPGALPAEARQAFTLTAAQRSLKALGTFGYQVGVAGKHEYAAFARRTWSHAKRSLGALGWDDLIGELGAFERL